MSIRNIANKTVRFNYVMDDLGGASATLPGGKVNPPKLLMGHKTLA